MYLKWKQDGQPSKHAQRKCDWSHVNEASLQPNELHLLEQWNHFAPDETSATPFLIQHNRWVIQPGFFPLNILNDKTHHLLWRQELQYYL